jgi:hypothetical protein
MVLSFKAHAHWQHFLAKTLATATDYLLSLATLGDTTQHKNDPISSAAPPKVSKVTKASSHVSLS